MTSSRPKYFDARYPLSYTLKIQLLVCIPVIGLAACFYQGFATSLMLGVAAYVVPNLYFTYYAFRYSGARQTALIKHSFLWGQMGKLALAIAAFALIFRFVNVLSVPALFAGFCGMIILQWFIGKAISTAASETQTHD